MFRSMLRYGSGNILIFALTDLLGNFGRSMVFPYASLYVLALGGDAAKIGLVAFLGQLAGLVLLPIAGHITDHADRVQIIVLAGFLSSLFMGLMVFAPTWQVLALASLLTGTVVFQFPAYASLIADSLSPDGRGRGIGVQNMISSSLAIFSPYIAGVIIARYSVTLGMRILYGVMLVVYLLSALIQLRFLKESPHAVRKPLRIAGLFKALNLAYRGIPAMLRRMSPSLVALTLMIVFTFIGNGMTGPFWVIFAIDHIKLTTSEWGLILLVESVVKVALFLPAGLLVDRWGRTRALVLALLIWSLANPLFIFLHGFWPLLLLRSLLSVAFVVAIPASTALMADLVPRSVRGQMMAALGQGGVLLGMVGSPGGPAVGYLIIPPLMIASLLGGFLYTLNPSYPWIAAAVTGGVCILLAAFSIRDPHKAEM